MPETVPDAKPPSPSVSSHSARSREGDEILHPAGRAEEEIAEGLHGMTTAPGALHSTAAAARSRAQAAARTRRSAPRTIPYATGSLTSFLTRQTKCTTPSTG